MRLCVRANKPTAPDPSSRPCGSPPWSATERPLPRSDSSRQRFVRPGIVCPPPIAPVFDDHPVEPGQQKNVAVEREGGVLLSGRQHTPNDREHIRHLSSDIVHFL